MKSANGRERKAVVRALVGLLLIFMSACAVHAQTDAAKPSGAAGKVRHVTELRGEWSRNGPAFVCKVPAGKLAPSAINPDMLARACQHMGPFVVGDDVQVLKATLGAPHRTLPQANGALGWLYFLEQQEHYPYFVATVSKNRIVALQVTGTAAAKGYDFNHVDLGMTSDALVQVFGQPSHFEPSEEKDTELWTYGVWPFSFEVKDGHVTSMRIHAP
jgi:hypothetical protein